MIKQVIFYEVWQNTQKQKWDTEQDTSRRLMHQELVTEAHFPIIHNFIRQTTAQTKLQVKTTRQHSYRKKDRAMRPIYGCPEKFSESSLRNRLLFQKFVMDFCSDLY